MSVSEAPTPEWRALFDAALAALALIELIDAAEVKPAPVADLSAEELGELFNGTETALREALIGLGADVAQAAAPSLMKFTRAGDA
jgi:hypothetical protein